MFEDGCVKLIVFIMVLGLDITRLMGCCSLGQFVYFFSFESLVLFLRAIDISYAFKCLFENSGFYY